VQVLHSFLREKCEAIQALDVSAHSRRIVGAPKWRAARAPSLVLTYCRENF
jgi:hypothetical protein